MFNNVSFADWSGPLAIVAFGVSFGVFLFFVIGAIRMPRKRVQHDEQLPLEKEKRS